MEKFEHPLVIVELINKLFGGLAIQLHALFGIHLTPDHEGHVIPPYMAMLMLILAFWTVLGFVLKSRLSAENPGKVQIILEDMVGGLAGMMTEWLGPTGVRFMPLIGGLGALILTGNYMGFFPGLMSPTSSINVTLGCAITTWTYYHLQGVKAQGIVSYAAHFMFPTGVPKALAPIMLPIELISHSSRVMSLSLRLFGNIFGEELVVAILAYIVPYVVPVVVQPLFLITSGLQAFIFVLLSIIYLQGATHVDHGHDHGDPSHGREHGAHGHDHGHAPEMAAHAA